MSKLDDILVHSIKDIERQTPYGAGTDHEKVINSYHLTDEAKQAIKELIYGLMTEAVHAPTGEIRYSDLEELVKAL